MLLPMPVRYGWQRTQNQPSSMDWRKNVPLAGTAYTWDTNLSDEALLEFYEVVRDDPEFAQSHLSVQGLSISLALFDKMVAFHEGYAWCVGFGTHFFVTYRTALGWELWEARKQELAELKQEQDEQRRIELLLFRTEDEFRAGQFHEAIAAGDFTRAESILADRGLARQTCEFKEVRDWFFQFVTESAIRLFHSFPDIGPGIRFLARFERPYWEYLRFAESRRFWKKPSLPELRGILDAASTRFPDNPFLFKEAALFLVRQGDLEGAAMICRTAIAHGLRDTTKSGFIGRLQRLEKRIKREGSQVSPLDIAKDAM